MDIILAKVFLIFVFCIAVKNNSWDDSLSWKFFFVVFNVVPALFLLQVSSCLVVHLSVYFLVLHNFLSLIRLLHFLERILFLFLLFLLWLFDCVPSSSKPSVFFNCPENSIFWIAFGSASNFFYLLKSIAINL